MIHVQLPIHLRVLANIPSQGLPITDTGYQIPLLLKEKS